MAGVTPRSVTISPQVMRLVSEIASKILRRVLSASAFDIFSISERSMDCPKCSGIPAGDASGNCYLPKEIPEISASNHFDSHLTIEMIRSLAAAARLPPEKGSGQIGN